MADKKELKNTPAPEKQIPNNVVALTSNKCTAESCKAKPARAGFCEEHYLHFKEGLITLDGYKAKDYDKKYHAWLRRQAA
jgi:hypothetical protein